jgi:putative membrane protein
MASALLCLPLVMTAMGDDERKLIDKKPVDREPTTDREFLIRAIACEVAEVKFAERAEKHATREDVRKTAQTMVEDHKKIRDEFLDQAKKMKVAVVEGLEKSHREQYDRLSKLDGVAFDREYVRHLVDGHEKSIKLFKKWAKEAKDADLRTVTDSALAKMQDHLTHAKKLNEKIKE